MPNALVLVIDRLGSGYLGPYGNTWIETPAWNQLAACSLLVETALGDTADLATLYHSYWQGRHAFWAGRARHSSTRRISGRPARRVLAGDRRAHGSSACGGTRFSRTCHSAGRRGTGSGAGRANAARTVVRHGHRCAGASPAPVSDLGTCSSHAGSRDRHTICGAGSRRMRTPIHPVRRCRRTALTADYDPDELLGYQHAYAGQVSLLDTCLSILLDAPGRVLSANQRRCWRPPRARLPVGRTSLRGACRATAARRTAASSLAAPLPAGRGSRLAITPSLVQPPDVYPTLLEWFDVALPDLPLWGRGALPRTLEHESRAARQAAVSMATSGRCVCPPGSCGRTQPESGCYMPNPTIAGNSMRSLTVPGSGWPVVRCCFNPSRSPLKPTIASVSHSSRTSCGKDWHSPGDLPRSHAH